MKRIILLFILTNLTFGISFSQETLQTVSQRGNVTTTNIEINPNADAFKSFSIKRLNTTTGTTSQIALANNKSFGQITWFPDLTATPAYAINIGANQLIYYNNGISESIWRSGNMGPGSGLNADLLDGLNSTSLLRYGSTTFTDPSTYDYPSPGLYFNAAYRPTNGVPNNNYASYFYLGNLSGDGMYAGLIAMGTNNGNLYTKRKTAGAWEANWRTLWDSGNFDPSDFLPLTGGTISGNITIGNNANQGQLNVNGNIKSRRIKVTQTEWPDYVFDIDYDLPSIFSVEKFIQENKHLPGVPSADSVIVNGLDLGGNQAVLLRKIEELTLYIIEQRKIIDAQSERNAILEGRMAVIEKLLTEGRPK